MPVSTLEKDLFQMDASYKLIFKGNIQPNTNIEDAKKSLCELIGISPKSIDKLFSGKAFAIAKNLTKQEAEDKLAKLQAIGLIVHLKGGEQAQQPNSQQSSNANKVDLEALSSTVKQSITSASEVCKSATSTFMSKASEVAADLKEQKESQANTVVIESNQTVKPKKSTIWQRRYFKIVAYISFFWATISIIAAILIATGTGVKVMDALGGPDVEAQETSYSYLAEELEKEEEQKYAVNDDNASYEKAVKESNEEQKAREERAKLIDDYFKQFEVNINAYAKELGQESVSSSGKRSQLKSMFTQLDNEVENNAFWKDLIRFTEDLADDASSLEELKKEDARKIEWMTALKWFTQRYAKNLEAQEQAAQQQDKKIAKTLDSIGPQLIAIGVAFGLFMNFTMILALLRIERNTRVGV